MQNYNILKIEVNMPNKLYEVNCSNLSKINCRLMYVTQAKYDTDWHSTMHTHPFCELFYVIKGRGLFHVEDECFNVKEDDLVVVNANISHTESSKQQKPLEYIVLGIEGISLLVENHRYILHNYEDYKHEILFYIKTLLLEASQKSAYYDIISQDLLEILIVNIIRRSHYTLKIQTSRKTNHECAFLEQYIDEHFSEDITLDKLAEISYMNKYYLVHAFKKYSGMTPISYLNQRRLQEACLLLKTTDYSISQIGGIVGISSQAYFSSMFRKTCGVTPQTYRRDNQNC